MPTLSEANVEIVVVTLNCTTIPICSYGDRLTHKMSRMIDSRILGEAEDCGWPASKPEAYADCRKKNKEK